VRDVDQVMDDLEKHKYTKKLGIFNWSRDNSRSKKSTETS